MFNILHKQNQRSLGESIQHFTDPVFVGGQEIS